MPGPQTFVVNPDRVVHETIETETIVIHLETGAYYSLQGTAGEIWRMLDHGCSSDEVVAELGRRSSASSDQIAPSVQDFVRELVREELVERRNGGARPGRGTGGPPPERRNGGPGAESRPLQAAPNGAFSPPDILKYTDMQYFLLLDPVHEVEPSGWPHAGATASD
jgi:hypothetical protein